MSYLVGVLSVGVTMSGYYSDGYGTTGISITFSVTISIYSGLDKSEYKPAKLTGSKAKADDKKDKIKSYIHKKTQELKNIYTSWESFLETSQRKASKEVIENMDVLLEKIKPMVIKQNEECYKLEKMILEIKSKLDGYKSYESGQYVGNFLTLIANCYQAIRDLTLTFYFGDAHIMVIPEMDAEIKELAEKLAKDYKNNAVMKKILKRRDVSTNILAVEKKLEAYSHKLMELKEKISIANNSNSDIDNTIAMREKTAELYDSFIDELYTSELDYYSNVGKDLDKNVSQIESKISLLNAEKNNLGVIAKKSKEEMLDKQIEFVKDKKKELENLKAQKDDIKSDISTAKGKTYSVSDDVKYLGAKKVINKEIANLSEKEISYINEIIESGRLHLSKLRDDYEKVIKDFPEALVN